MRNRIAVFAAAVAAIVAIQAAIAVPDSRAGAPSTDWTMSLDCDVNTAGIQSGCSTLPGALIDVDAVLTNNTATSVQFGRFGLGVLNPDVARLYARDVNGMDLPDCGAPYFDCNPDFLLDGAGAYSCSVPRPDNDLDQDGNPSTQESFIDCMNGAADGQMIASGGSVALARVKYRVPGTAQAGSVPLTMFWTDAGDESFGELGSCNPMISTPMDCVGATITVVSVSMSVDCNATTTGIQSNCNVSNMGTTRDVRVSLTNHTTSPIMLSSFEFIAINSDASRLFAPVINPPGSLNDNPDAAPAFAAPNWDCGPLQPDNDIDADGNPATQESFIYCFSGTSFLNIPAMSTAHLVTIHYNIPAGADPGTLSLTLRDSSAHNSAFEELGSCNPVVTAAMPCNAATITMYCPIDKADVNNDNYVNVADLGITASKVGTLPAPALYDQNTDGIINVADLGLVAIQKGKHISMCP